MCTCLLCKTFSWLQIIQLSFSCFPHSFTFEKYVADFRLCLPLVSAKQPAKREIETALPISIAGNLTTASFARGEEDALVSWAMGNTGPGLAPLIVWDHNKASDIAVRILATQDSCAERLTEADYVVWQEERYDVTWMIAIDSCEVRRLLRVIELRMMWIHNPMQVRLQ